MQQIITMTLHTAELDMASTVETSDIDVFLTDAAWAISSTYNTVQKASPGAAIFGWDMLFIIPFFADWNKIGEHRHTKLTSPCSGKIAHAMIEITKLAISYFLEEMVSSTNQKVGMKVIH